MTDEVFRIIVTAAVALACLATLVQAGVAVALYRAIRGMQDKTAPLLDRAKPVMERIDPILDRVEGALQKAGPVIEKIGPVVERAGPILDRVGPIMDKVGPVIQKIGPVVDQAGLVLGNTNQLLVETRPRVVQFSDEMVGIAKSGREQVDRVGEFLRETGDRAAPRLEQIDRTVEQTVGQVEQVGDVVKRAVMTPVREVNGLAAGISAAVSTFVHRPRRPQVDQATQDEELFI
jgi:ABC-type transporter Mla subunit MlaD